MDLPFFHWTPFWRMREVPARRSRLRPMGAEVLTSTQLGAYAKELAKRYKVAEHGGSNRLLSRLNENERILQCFNRSTAEVLGSRRSTRQVTPAAEWLLDNGYLVDEQVRTARRHLPQGYSRELPRLLNGPSSGLPRVYDLALEFLCHVDAQLEVESLHCFVEGYQSVSPLKLGELWAIPIMLRLGLLENLRRITERLSEARVDRDLAERWGNRLASGLEDKSSDPIVIVAEISAAGLALTSAFVAEFSQRLARLGPAVQLARNWLEQQLAKEGRTIEQVVLQESQEQAATQVSVSHGIASLRLLGTLDWRKFVETHSFVEHILRRDPAGVYVRMDFATRDEYRHGVETIARDSGLPEIQTAERAIERAYKAAQSCDPEDARAHVGHYLVGDARPDLEAMVGTRWTTRLRPERLIRRCPLSFYLGGILGVTLTGTLALAWMNREVGVGGAAGIVIVAALLVAMSQVGVSVMNWLSPFLVSPRRLPRMDFAEGLTADCRTMVVIPTLITERRVVDQLLETLEIHFLANRDPHLHFVLLTDFKDAATESTEADEDLLLRTCAGIQRLNETYESDRFFLFHRPRRWNSKEGVWMGYERKRGKLGQFNAYLRGGARDCFSHVIGDPAIPPQVRYVITLDTDTQLPLDAARRLVGTISHPLNRPSTEAATGIVKAGYGILQPRVGITLSNAGRSWFARLFTGEAGIDPYTRAVSDVYQDVFNEGSFIGKGIYDVDAFERATEGRFPENAILSHDLIESAHARSALVSDVELYEDYPSRFNADIRRRHRWIRGDWQIAPWLFPRVPGGGSKFLPNPLSLLSRWKIFDNLRRSLVAPSLVTLLLGAWLWAPEIGGLCSTVVILVLLFPALLSLGADLVRKPQETGLGGHLRTASRRFARHAAQAGLNLVILPYDAWVCLDAIVRTLGRLLVTRRHLLEWQTSSDAESASGTDLGGFLRTMWIAPAIGVATVVALAVGTEGPVSLYAAGLCLFWLMAPGVAWWISQPLSQRHPEFTANQLAFLRGTARQTWSFFEELVSAKDRWLPPDNLQEVPTEIIARRTSPTNMGVALLSTLAARDLGYLSLSRMIQRISASVRSMEALERYRGHFFNWYSTDTGLPLPPHYISTVDSGNLAGHLLTLAAGLSELCDSPVYTPVIFEGLRDTLEQVRSTHSHEAAWKPVSALLERPPSQPDEALVRLSRLVHLVEELRGQFPRESAEARRWVDRFHGECRDHVNDLQALEGALASARGTGSVTEPGASNATPGNLSIREVAAHDPESVDSGPYSSSREGTEPRTAAATVMQLEDLAQRCARLATEMDFEFLFEPERKLFTIGYNVSDRRRDASYYDLLASEARLCSYLCVARRLAPPEHWFHLGRLLGEVEGEVALMSWSGSMFEYLMPLLVMPTYDNTLMARTCQAVVAAQIRYGHAKGVPWGISESGYHAFDTHGNYQYRAFGMPGLGFKRGLGDDLVIAPYATLLALMVDPQAACKNLQRLADDGMRGRFGFYEAIDYTASRLAPEQSHAIIRSFMAHHQGMALLALVYVLKDRPMQRRFLSFPCFKAAELLLQERVPHSATRVDVDPGDTAESPRRELDLQDVMRVYTTPNTPQPEVHLLSNGRYHVMVSQSGGGYSRWENLAVTRWREDPTRDCWGSFCYLRDLGSGEVYSTAYQPTLRLGHQYEAIFTQGRAEFRQRFGPLELHTEIAVSPEDDVELRRLSITNHGSGERTLEVTTYSEIVLAPQAADTAHPAFTNLFVQTEFDSQRQALLCTRRPRAASDPTPWLVHLLTVGSANQSDLTFETDRARFLGRGRTPASPAAMDGSLSGTSGAVLDPIVSLRRRIRIGPDETVRLDQVTGVAEDRAGALNLAEKYSQHRLADRLFDLAWTQSQVTLRHLDCTEAEAQEFGRLAGALIQANPTRRAGPSVLLTKHRGRSGLWSYGVSGDLPIVLVRIGEADHMQLVRRALQAHAYWRIKGLIVDLVILNEDSSTYRQSLHEQIIGLIASGPGVPMLEIPGGVFVRRLEQIPQEDRTLFFAAARIVLADDRGSFSDQARTAETVYDPMPALIPVRSGGHSGALAPMPSHRELTFENGLGGFSADGSEYVIQLSAERRVQARERGRRSQFLAWSHAREKVPASQGRRGTREQMSPSPWINVLANPTFGTTISESGAGYTWFENSHEFRLTPWHNDPVSDSPGEVYYVRDEETGQFWSPTPLPAGGNEAFTIRHGFGYTVFDHCCEGIASELTICVAPDAPIKLVTLRLRNLSERERRLSVTGYWEWVLGESRSSTGLHVQTRLDAVSGALIATNPFNSDFADRVVFAHVEDSTLSCTGDRREFLGRNGTLATPAAMKRLRLSGRTGAGFDSCGALQVTVELGANEERQITFRLGAGRSLGEVQDLIRRFRQPQSQPATLEAVRSHWTRMLGGVQVRTPDAAADILVNGWLLYQTLGARFWGRTGFYQSGGAFGFRDQLQDSMALVHADPALVREHLLRAASRQFKEGDVQHWWHPPSGRGVRTRISDDLLWLPYAVCRYVRITNDVRILDEIVPYLEGRSVKPDEEGYYDLPDTAEQPGTLYEHCVRAIERGFNLGKHGLPLIGSGDWNDGFNLVGHLGAGESVWLGFFLVAVLSEFSEIAHLRGDDPFSERCRLQAQRLQLNLEEHAWDGDWYRRAWFDDGTPLGSRVNEECRIDSLPQSWSVLAGTGDSERSRQAMESVMTHLVQQEARLIQLFDPPFDRTALNPGYIKGYVPGVRENGGQYTHAAIWTIMAMAELGHHDRAWELLELINPILHGANRSAVATYKVEPYVVAADVYSVGAHSGRGGWTWYTGSSGWMYRLITETLLGLHRKGDLLRLDPKVPTHWRRFEIRYQYGNSTYHLFFTRGVPPNDTTILIQADHHEVHGNQLKLREDGGDHRVQILFAGVLPSKSTLDQSLRQHP